MVDPPSHLDVSSMGWPEGSGSVSHYSVALLAIPVSECQAFHLLFFPSSSGRDVEYKHRDSDKDDIE